MQWLLLLVFIPIFVVVSANKIGSVSSKNKTKLFNEKNDSEVLPIKSNTDAFQFLSQFGYNPCQNPLHSNSKDVRGPSCLSSMESMLEKFQRAFHLPKTKKLDATTLKMMNTPRCGIPDGPLALIDRSNLW
jgi:hypothetical protein